MARTFRMIFFISVAMLFFLGTVAPSNMVRAQVFFCRPREFSCNLLPVFVRRCVYRSHRCTAPLYNAPHRSMLHRTVVRCTAVHCTAPLHCTAALLHRCAVAPMRCCTAPLRCCTAVMNMCLLEGQRGRGHGRPGEEIDRMSDRSGVFFAPGRQLIPVNRRKEGGGGGRGRRGDALHLGGCSHFSMVGSKWNRSNVPVRSCYDLLL